MSDFEEADALRARIGRVIAGGYMAEKVLPMAAITLRFPGKAGHLGRAVDAALSRMLALAPPGVTYRGFLTKSKDDSVRIASPKALTGAGRTLLTKTFAAMRAMPSAHTDLYFKDGADNLVPASFAIHLSLCRDAEDRGTLSIGVPLDQLGHERWLALAEALFAELSATVAWMGPALWLAPFSLFNSSTNQLDLVDQVIELFATDPQLEVPSWFGRATPFRFAKGEAGTLDGLVAPSWRIWLAAARAALVKRYRGERVVIEGGVRFTATPRPPFSIDEGTYATWREAWKDLAPVQASPERSDPEATLYRERFDATSLAERGRSWREARATELTAREAEAAITRRISELGGKPTAELLAYATARMGELTSTHHWYLADPLRELVIAGVLPPAEVGVWLDAAEQACGPKSRIFRRLAALATAAGDHVRAIDLLSRAIKTGYLDGTVASLKTDPEFKALRKHPTFAALVKT